MAVAPPLRRGRPVVGAEGFLAGACAWALISAAVAGGNPVPMIGVIAASGASLAAGFAVSRTRPWVVPAIVLAAAGIVAAAAGSEITSALPTKGPFGYANATGSFYVQAVVAGLMLAAAVPRPWRWVGFVGAAAAAVVVVANGSTAARVLLVLVAAGAAVALTGARRPVAIGLGALSAIALVGTLAVGVASDPFAGGVPGSGVFDATRKALWNEAVGNMTEHPIVGVGPGGFAEAAPSRLIDTGLGKAHNGFLQIGAETGVVGMGLVVLAFGWLFASVAGRSDPILLAVLGTLALAAFAVGACVDYLMHFPGIPVTAAALAGTAMSQLDA